MEGLDFDFGFDAGSLLRDNDDDLEALEVADGDNYEEKEELEDRVGSWGGWSQ
jgi:hypothetical protein